MRLGQRKDVLTVVTLASESGPAQPSISVLDALTGRVRANLHVPGTNEVLTNDCPTKQGYLFGPATPLGSGQTALLTVSRSTQPVDANGMPYPCDALLGFRDEGGSPLTSAVTGPLNPGHATSLALNANTFNLRVGQTVNVAHSVLPVGTVNVEMPSGAVCPLPSDFGCKTSLQVIDNFTAWTLLISLAQ